MLLLQNYRDLSVPFEQIVFKCFLRVSYLPWMLQINHNSNGIFFGSGFLTFFCDGRVTTFNLKLESDITLLLWFTCSLRHLLVDCGLWKVSAVSTCNPRARLEQAGMLSFIYRIISKETLNLKSKTGKQKSETSREPKLELKSENSRARARAASSNRFFPETNLGPHRPRFTPFRLLSASWFLIRLSVTHPHIDTSPTGAHMKYGKWETQKFRLWDFL